MLRISENGAKKPTAVGAPHLHAERSDWQLFNRDVTYGDDVIHIESADGLDRFNGHGYRTLPRAVQDLKRTDGATYYSEPLPLQDGDSDYKVVCYYGSWAIYRDEPMTFSPPDVAANGCTHFIYSFVGLDPQSLTITILDKEYDLIRGEILANKS